MSHDHGQVCPCMADHRPFPLELERHHILPLAAGGPDTLTNTVFICPTTHTNTHEILREIVRRTGRLTWTDATALWEVPVNRFAFSLAHEGYARMAAAL